VLFRVKVTPLGVIFDSPMTMDRYVTDVVSSPAATVIFAHCMQRHAVIWATRQLPGQQTPHDLGHSQLGEKIRPLGDKISG